jgi:hypothetical protein
MVPGTPMDIPGTGHYVSFADTEGNHVFLLQPRQERDLRETKKDRRAGSDQ